MDDLFLPGHRAPVLLLHGLCSSPLELQMLALRINRAGHAVSVPYIRGYGRHRADPTPLQRQEAWLAEAARRCIDLAGSHGPVTIGGLCIGADLALAVAHRLPAAVAGLLLISTTLYYDGWNTPWYRWLLPLAGPTPLKHMYKLRETEPFGIKNERIREWVSRQMARTGDSAAGASSLPLTALYEAYRLMRGLRRVLPQITQPALVLHSQHDDMAGLRSPSLLAARLGSRLIEKHIYADSYHMLTLDNDREAVAGACISFLDRIAGALPASDRKCA